jgi:hypothetical protein
MAVIIASSYPRSPTISAEGPLSHTVSMPQTIGPQPMKKIAMAGIPDGRALPSSQTAGSMLSGFALRNHDHSIRKVVTVVPDV